MIKTKRFLGEHHELLLIRSDKDNATVVMKKNECITVMSEMMDDQLVYKNINVDPTNKYQMKINKLVRKFVNESVIDDLMGKNLTTLNAALPRLYGLRKVDITRYKIHPVITHDGSVHV